MKNTSDALRVTFDASHTDESVICVARAVNGKIDVLKMELGEQAELLYHLLTEKTAKVEIAESKEQDVVSRQEVLKYFKGWKNQIKYYPPYAKNFDIPYEVIDEIRAEIEHMIPCSKETLSMKLGVLEIIDKYIEEDKE